MIEVTNLRKVFAGGRRGDVAAVDGISFTAHPGRILALLGPNGAGKTTTLRMLATILAPTSGTALVDGVDVAKDPVSVRGRIGYLSGDTGVYERMTAREMVAYFGRLHGMSAEAVRARTEEIFALLRMGDFGDRMAGTYSAGQKQKLSIARTIVHDPPVLIFDEPTANLDVLVARTVLEFLDEVRRRGKCVVLSTHVFSEAERLADDVAVIHRGRILAKGTLDEVKGGRPLEDSFFSLVLAEGDA